MAMREERIIVRPFEELRVEEYEGVKQVNEHGYVRLTGMIPFEKREEYLGLARKQTWVRITAMADDIQHVLFYGIVEHVKIHVVGGPVLYHAADRVFRNPADGLRGEDPQFPGSGTDLQEPARCLQSGL